jgi:hypothetical protein
MKYEIHVGDYVETNDRRVGYITETGFTYMPYFIWVTKGGEPYYEEISSENIDEWGFILKKTFKRIGQYDFTKPEVKKIEHFEYNYPCSELRLTAKINELVDAVNELREKLN